MAFDAYANYYDLLYRDKNYSSEAKFVSEILHAHGLEGNRLLELGCGTGRHAVEFARRGYSVTGVDLSDGMVRQAVKRSELEFAPGSNRPSFRTGDVRTVRLSERYDAVLSLFHVICYQTSDEDVRAAFRTATEHLRPGGLFFFDFWYGPAVQRDPPGIRVRRLCNDNIQVTRIAEAATDVITHRVLVNYHVFVKELASGAISELKESHALRFFFLPELERFLRDERIELVSSCAWMHPDRILSPDTWYGCVVARYSGLT